MRLALEHDPEKWAPVFRKDHAQKKIGHLTSLPIDAASIPPIMPLKAA
jgi:hypothetical protein